MSNGIGIKNLRQILGAAYQVLVDSGTTTGGSGTTLEDTAKSWVANEFVHDRVEFTIDATLYRRIITSNTDTELTFAALPPGVSVPSGISYEIWRYVGVSDLTDRAARLLGVVDSLTKWGGTALTPRDISLDLANITKLIPLAKAAIFNTALPDAEANWLGTDITPTNSPSYLRIYACVSVTGILRVARKVDAVPVTEDLNSGTALTADAAYIFDVPWRTGDSINIRYSVTTGTIKRLLIDEIGAAV